jgi:hypothetical protein
MGQVAELPDIVGSSELGAPQPGTDDFDWMQFKNGEWLKGEIKELQDQSFSFESDELDTLQLDWDDILVVYSPRVNTCVFEDDITVLGSLRIIGDEVTVVTPEGEKRYDRAKLRSILPGGQSEWDYWSLKFSLGTTVRRGNTDQTDLSSFLRVQRRSPTARTRFEYRGTYGTFDEEETINNQLATFRHDIFLSRKLYLTVPSLQYYADKFKNIDYRLTPGAGVGYQLYDRGDIDWDIGGGAGYQYTRFRDVGPGEDSSVEGVALLAATDLDWELTEKIDLVFKYNTTIGLSEDMGVDHHALATLEVDIWGDLELDVSLTWDRVGSPQGTSGGDEPDADDVTLTVGIGWEL